MVQNSTLAANSLTLTDFSNFSKISDSTNFASNCNSEGVYFSLEDNETLDSVSELYRYPLDQNYYDFNFSIGFTVTLEKPSAIQFKMTLESKYTENGTYLEGNYTKICSTSFVSNPADYNNDLIYLVEFYPNDSYVKRQSSAFSFYMSDVEFLFSRANGSLNCLIKAGVLDNMYDKYTASYDLGVNRTLDSVCLELSLNSLQCNSFTIDVNSISGELYDFIKEEPNSTLTPLPSSSISKISLNLPGISTIVSIAYLVFFTIKVRTNSKRKTTN